MTNARTFTGSNSIVEHCWIDTFADRIDIVAGCCNRLFLYLTTLLTDELATLVFSSLLSAMPYILGAGCSSAPETLHT